MYQTAADVCACVLLQPAAGKHACRDLTVNSLFYNLQKSCNRLLQVSVLVAF
jgi:hypothetical protein